MIDKWDERFMAMAVMVGTWSKDRSRGVGCVIVGGKREVRAIGYNGFPRGIDDTDDLRHERPAKYLWTEHAERNAIYNAARIGVRLEGCTAYVPWFPCTDCARSLIQAGINELVAYEPDFDDPKWGDDFQIARRMLYEAKVAVHFLPGAVPDAR
jgi:dCMP deaminase